MCAPCDVDNGGPVTEFRGRKALSSESETISDSRNSNKPNRRIPPRIKKAERRSARPILYFADLPDMAEFAFYFGPKTLSALVPRGEPQHFFKQNDAFFIGRRCPELLFNLFVLWRQICRHIGIIACLVFKEKTRHKGPKMTHCRHHRTDEFPVF